MWRVPIYKLQEPGNFNSLGIFWQDGIANSAAFWFMHQGLILRFLSARTAKDARKAFTVTLFILMPLATICVSSAGWIGRAMVEAGLLPTDVDPKHIFITVANTVVHTPGFFGLILAALTAALMSTADTLINAVAAVSINDIYRRFWVKNKSDKHYLLMARWISIGAAIVGVSIVPIYMKFKSIYVAHGAFTAAITPPLVVPILLAAFWRRFTAKAALTTMVGGVALVGISIWKPQVMEWCRMGIAEQQLRILDTALRERHARTDRRYVAGVRLQRLGRDAPGVPHPLQLLSGLQHHHLKPPMRPGAVR